MNQTHPAIQRAEAFAADYGLRLPIIMAPMAGASPSALAAAVARAGGMGALGAMMSPPAKILDWARQTRAASNGAFLMNTWVPDPAPARDLSHEAAVRAFLANWGPEVAAEAAEAPPPDFAAECEAMLDAGPAVMSSIMGLFPPEIVARMKERGVRWFATATTVAEARAAEAAGADAIVAQGAEAGGHRGTFVDGEAEGSLVGLVSLVPAVADAVRVPVIATGGIADGRAMAAALLLGASAVQVGTALLRAPEAGIPIAYADAIGAAAPEDTTPTRAFSGRLGRSLRTAYLTAEDAPTPAPFPIQRNLTGAMRSAATAENRLDGMSAWAGQSARLARAAPAGEIVEALWRDATSALSGASA